MNYTLNTAGKIHSCRASPMIFTPARADPCRVTLKGKQNHPTKDNPLKKKVKDQMTLKIHYNKRGCPRAKYYYRSINTVDHNAVTCEACLKFIAKHNLRPRSEFPKVPTFSPVRRPGRVLVMVCPVCGEEAIHFSSSNEIGSGDGHRCAECECWPGGYHLQEKPCK